MAQSHLLMGRQGQRIGGGGQTAAQAKSPKLCERIQCSMGWPAEPGGPPFWKVKRLLEGMAKRETIKNERKMNDLP